VSDAELDFVLEGTTRDEILHHFLGPLSPEQIAHYARQKDAIFRHEENRVQTVPGLEEFLDLVRSASIPMAVASSASKVRVKRMLDDHGLTDRFGVILTGDDVRVGKKNPAIFLRVAEELRARPYEVVVIEDAFDAVRVVKKVGMKCVGIAAGTRRSKLLEAGADLVVPNFVHLELSDITALFQNPTAGTWNLSTNPA